MTKGGASFAEMARKLNLKDRLLSRVSLSNSGCWEWTGHLTSTGYSQMTVGSRTDKTRTNTQAHRVSYAVFVGELVDGLQIDHLCRNRKCINPKHLEQVTCAENLRRGNPAWKQQMARTHCPKGHEYSESNTYVRKSGGRMCKECSRISCRVRARAKRALLRTVEATS